MNPIQQFLADARLQDDVCVQDVEIDQLHYTIVYAIQFVDIQKFNFEIKPHILPSNYQQLTRLFLGLCKPITDCSVSELEFLLYSGKILVFFEDHQYHYYFEFTNKPKRSISESTIDPEDPMSSRDGLVEDLDDNITLIKRRLKTNDLQIKKYQLGLINKNTCAVMYMKSFHDKLSLHSILERLSQYKEEIVTSINDIAMLYQDDSLLPQVFNTSSPDIITNALVKGRIVIFLDNSPVALIIPVTLSIFTNSKTYINTPKYYAFFNHFFVFIFFAFSIFSMGLFISIINFHRGALSIAFLANVQITEKGTNWPMFVEVMIVYLLFEFYRFSTSRSTNNYIQNIIIILGGLFIGQNAIESGTIGAIILFLTSISYIAVFAVTNNTYLITSINIFRFFILILSYTMGIFGFLISSLIVTFYLYKQKNGHSFYLYPFIPFQMEDFKSYFIPKKELKKVTE